MKILLTNDDGINAPGLRALAGALNEIGDVRVLAPISNQSAVGRGLSYGRMGPDRDHSAGGIGHAADENESFTVTIPHEAHDLGYAVHGTPCDCVILGVNAFDRPDLVVAGCNPGVNLGAYVLARSGTASAATEAACLEVPGIAVSMDTLGMNRSALGIDAFERACAVATAIIEQAIEGAVFESDGVEYLNVNVPRPGRPFAGIEVTRPTPVYEMAARFEDGAFRLRNPLWAGMAARDIPDGEGTDRRAILADRVSVSPLSLPHAPIDDDVLARLDAVFAETID